MSFDREELTNALAAHGRVARVVVVKAHGSTAREPGTTMLVWNGGQSGQVVKHAPVNTHHMVLTYSHALDLEICHQILSGGFATAGLIGSKTKWARFRKRLKALGHSENLISRIKCPIGDPNLGKHPQEIAVSVASSLLSRRSVMSAGRAAQID